MTTLKLTNRELEAIYNCLEYTYDNIDSDMSLMDDEEAHDQLIVVKALSERIKAEMEANQA